MKTEKNNSILLSILFIISAALTRFITVLPNFSILESLALFGGAYLASRYIAVLIPIAVMYMSDFVINNTVTRVYFPDQEGIIFFSNYMIWNVVAMVGIVFLAKFIFKKVTMPRFLGGVLGATIIFFLVTNFGSWASGVLYTKDFSGLMTCFAAGLPFLKNSLLGNFVFATVLFGSYEFISNYIQPTNATLFETVDVSDTEK